MRRLTMEIALCLALAAAGLGAGCGKGSAPAKGRDAAPQRDGQCQVPARPKAFFYPKNGAGQYSPDDPLKDGCEVLVPDHLFCCPAPVKTGEPR